MTGKADFNAEEWDKIAKGPALAGLIVIAAQRGGTIRETLAMAKVYKEAQQTHGSADFLGELTSSAPSLDAREFSSKEDMHTRGLQMISEAVALVEAKVSSEELADYKSFSMAIAERAAEADKSGGFLGIGGEHVSGNEEAALNDVAAALGTERTPASPS